MEGASDGVDVVKKTVGRADRLHPPSVVNFALYLF